MTKRIKIFIFAAAVFVLIFNVVFGLFLMQRNTKSASENQPAISVRRDQFSYKGEESKNALELLKQKTSIEQSSSGLITSINGRKADDGKKEFWAFYVNGKMAEIGPADYKTKAGDLIEWKIQNY